MNRKQRRSEISEFILHSKSFIKEKEALKETVLDDGSIKFYIEGFASTEVQDGSGDIVKVDGIDTSRYEINPVLQRGHKRGSENTIGKIVKIDKVAGKGMYIGADVILNPEIEDHKAIIHGLRHGLINGFSIGFKEVQSRYDDMAGANIIEKLELYEISLVDIPDNPLTVRKFIDNVISKSTKEDDVEDTEDETEEDKACGTKPKKPKKEGEVEEEVVAEPVENQETPVSTEAGNETTEDKPEYVVVVATDTENTPEKTEDVNVEDKTEEKPVEDTTDVEEDKKDEVEPETKPEEVKPDIADITPEVINVDLDKSAKVETKALMLNEIAVGDMLLYRSVWENCDRGVYIYPELEDKPKIGYLFGIKTVGTVLTGCCEFEEATVEEPFLYILNYQEVNGTLVPTQSLTVACIEDLLIEGKYTGEAKAVFVPETKELDNTQDNLTSKPNGNVEGVDNDEESEKNSGNAMVIKSLEEDKQEIEKMLTDMIAVNEKALKEVQSLKAIIDKVRKTKSAIGFQYTGQDELGNSKIAGIVGLMRK